MTLTEVLVVVVTSAFLILVLFVALKPAFSPTKKIACEDNLRQIGLAFRVWPRGQSDKYPMAQLVTQGGAMELAVTGNVVAIFGVMSNELSTPKVLVCPLDADHRWATNWTIDFGSRNISYFVGLDATYDKTNTILTGDDNLAIKGVPLKAGVFELSTNTPIVWTAERHNLRGNIGYGGLSFLVTSNSGFASAIVNQYRFSSDFTNRFRIAIP